MELVTEPVIHDVETAGKFARELQLLLRTIGISDANMEKGEMRVEANISVSKTSELGTKVEVKNLNSFRSVESAIKYEVARQIAVLEAGGEVSQETRGWDEQKSETYLQRSKETAKDYRYFPDPDIPKYQIDAIPAFSKTNLAEILPELPKNKRSKYNVLGLTDLQIETVIQDDVIMNYFEACLQAGGNETGLPTVLVNYLLTDLVPLWTKTDGTNPLSAAHFVALMRLVIARKVTSRVAKDLIIEFASADGDLVAIATERGLLSTMTPEALETIVRGIVAEHESVVAEYKGGKVASLQFLLGQAMKQTKGAADPTELKRLFETIITTE